MDAWSQKVVTNSQRRHNILLTLRQCHDLGVGMQAGSTHPQLGLFCQLLVVRGPRVGEF